MKQLKKWNIQLPSLWWGKQQVLSSYIVRLGVVQIKWALFKKHFSYHVWSSSALYHWQNVTSTALTHHSKLRHPLYYCYCYNNTIAYCTWHIIRIGPCPEELTTQKKGNRKKNREMEAGVTREELFHFF